MRQPKILPVAAALKIQESMTQNNPLMLQNSPLFF